MKGNILKSYTGSVSRPATILFVNNIPVKAYCGCAVGKSGVCCHVIALLIQLKSDGQEILTIEWQELKNRFPSFFVHK